MNEMVNLIRYPIHEPESEAYQQLVAEKRQELAQQGACELAGFIKPDALPRAVSQVEALAPQAFFKEVQGNCYLSATNPSLPDQHPINRTERTCVGVIAYDQIPTTDLFRQLYESPALLKFVNDVYSRAPVYRYSCPMGALNYSVMRKGDYLRWHFDQADFVVSIPVQDPEQGGVFEYVRKIRDENQENYDQVELLLEGCHQGVKEFNFTPGSLVFFEGRHTIHRVTPIKGSVLRLGVLLGYSLVPDQKSDEYLRKIRYGR